MKYEKNKSVVHAIKVLCSIAVFVCGLYLSFPAEAAGTFTEWGGTRLADYGFCGQMPYCGERRWKYSSDVFCVEWYAAIPVCG